MSKTTTRKLRNGPTISVDMQIIRWRERLRKEGRELGRHMRKEREQRRRQKQAKNDAECIAAGTKKFFK